MGARFTTARPSSGRTGDGFSTSERRESATGSSSGGGGEGGGGHEPCCVTITVVTVTPAVPAFCVRVCPADYFLVGKKMRERTSASPVWLGCLSALFPIRSDFPCECRVLRRSLILTPAAGIAIDRWGEQRIMRREYKGVSLEMMGGSLNLLPCQLHGQFGAILHNVDEIANPASKLPSSYTLSRCLVTP